MMTAREHAYVTERLGAGQRAGGRLLDLLRAGLDPTDAVSAVAPDLDPVAAAVVEKLAAVRRYLVSEFPGCEVEDDAPKRGRALHQRVHCFRVRDGGVGHHVVWIALEYLAEEDAETIAEDLARWEVADELRRAGRLSYGSTATARSPSGYRLGDSKRSCRPGGLASGAGRGAKRAPGRE